MAEGTYVKLTKAQDSSLLQDIKPGELNEPIDVKQLTAHKCHECGQALPETYQPPADEDWITGICGCAEDFDSCWTGLFCPCVLFGRNVESSKEDNSQNRACLCHLIFVEGGMTLAAITAMWHGIDPDTATLICEGVLFAWWVCGIYTGMARQELQRKYHLKDSPCDPCMVHCCMHWCALCQEHREMKGRLAESFALTTVMKPPPVQAMIPIENQDHNQTEESSSSSGKDDGHGLERQTV